MKKQTDWLLLVLCFAKEEGLTPAQLQKTVFLLQKAFPKADKLDYNFKPYNYGPFDVNVYNDVELLAIQGLVEIHKKNGHNWNTYHISANGKEIAKDSAESLDAKMAVYVKKLVEWVQSISFQTLIGSIYKKYPEYKKNSIFKE